MTMYYVQNPNLVIFAHDCKCVFGMVAMCSRLTPFVSLFSGESNQMQGKSEFYSKHDSRKLVVYMCLHNT